MPPAPCNPQESLRRLVLRLILMVACVLPAGVARLRERLAGMRAGHRHRAGLERELAKAERAAVLLADPAFWMDPATVGKAAEVARVAGDAGRRAIVRRMMWPIRLCLGGGGI